MSKFYISGFADEIAADFETQLIGLSGLGIGFIEIRGVSGRNISVLSNNELREAQKLLDHYGIRVSSIGSPIGKIGLKDDFAAHLEMAKRIMETAHQLNSPYVRLFSFFMPKDEDPAAHREEVLERMGAIVELAEGSGLTLLHENEKEIYGDTAERCLDLMTALHKPYFGCAFDPANFVQCGVEVFPHAYELLKPHIRYLHIKDALADGTVVPAGQGTGKVEEVLKAVKAAGYEGFLSLEPHLGDFTGFAALEHAPDGNGGGKLEPSGLHTFRLAYDSLKSILTKI